MDNRRNFGSSNGVNIDIENDEVTTVDGQKYEPLPKKTNREIIINSNSVPNEHQSRFRKNGISTAKYNVFTFLPKFLYEQFRRYANIFFLAIGLLQQIPDVSPTGRYVTLVPFMFILMLSALKELVEDWKRHRADDKVNNASTNVLNDKGKFIKEKWKNLRVGDVIKVYNNEFFPADLVTLASSEPKGMCYVETSNLDGETNLKIRTAVSQTYKEFERNEEEVLRNLNGRIECEEPNRNLYEFIGNIQMGDKQQIAPLSQSAILLRGAKLMNTQHIYGVVVYSGHDTKLIMNSKEAPLKRSNIDKITNYQIIFLFIILVVIALASALGSFLIRNDIINHSYLPTTETNYFLQFLTFFILYNNLIPISLLVTLEGVKFVQAYFVNWDSEMYYAPTDTYALARTSNLNEELGQIKYVFSDKTGTLTQNVMAYNEASIAGKRYSTNTELTKEPESLLLSDMKNVSDKYDDIKDFLTLMSVCHTVIPEYSDDGELSYNASSPDERALVEGASKYGFVFIDRKPDSVIIEVPGGTTEEYEVLNVIEFTSSRKRMSVIVRCPNGVIKLLTKGADTMILDRLGQSDFHKMHFEATIKHLDEFAISGLRTLCLAVRTIEEDDYKVWNSKFHEASIAIEGKDKKIDEVAELMESNLRLLGATAIEDKLQDGVPETIAQLLDAHIHVWVLTGDKQETAINIGHSCKLLKNDGQIIILNTTSLDETRTEVNEHLLRLHHQNKSEKENDVSVVVDGKTLMFALEHSLRKDFIELLSSCSSVICCRVSPLQKAEVVELVQEHTKSICLAIGDGANDVAMIQKAHVGVGISGNEGLQAANTSDFAIGQFRFLSRLLFLHGAWFYTRVSKVILYSFYKNICLYIIELWFAIYNAWTGQVLFERWTIGLYNLLMTAAPPIAIGLFDQNCTEENRLRYPALYRETQKSAFFNHKVFWKWIMNAIIHSAILYWLPMFAYGTGIVWNSGKNGDYLVVGNIVYSCVMITVCLRAGLAVDGWNWLIHLSIWGSISLWFLFLAVYSYIWPAGNILAPNMVGMIVLLMETPAFWLCILLVPITALIPDVSLMALNVTVFTSATDQIRLAEAAKSDPGPFISDIKSDRANTKTPVINLRRRNDNDIEMTRGYAFSQEEGGAISQTEYIRRYDTTSATNRSKSNKSGESRYTHGLEEMCLPGVVAT